MCLHARAGQLLKITHPFWERAIFKQSRGLNRSRVLQLATCHWIKQKQNLLISAPTSVGKSCLACDFSHPACREGYSVLYLKVARLFADLTLARGDGRYVMLMATFANTALLVLDDYGLAPFTMEQRYDFQKL